MARQFGPLRHPLQLTADGLVLDPGVVHEQEILAEDHRQKVIAFKRQGKPRGRIPGVLDDAQVAAARFDDDIAAAQMDAVLMRSFGSKAATMALRFSDAVLSSPQANAYQYSRCGSSG